MSFYDMPSMTFHMDDVNSTMHDVITPAQMCNYIVNLHHTDNNNNNNNTWNSDINTFNNTAADARSIMGYVYFYLTAVMSLLSVLGTVTIILTYCLFKELRTTGRRLLVYLSVADFFTAVGNLLGIIWYQQNDAMGPRTSKWLCQFHAALTICSSISSFLWTVAMAMYLYVSIRRRDARLAEKLTIPFHIVCWPLPVAIAAVAWGCGVLGYGSRAVPPYPSWCWICTDSGDKTWTLFWQYMTGKAWEILSYFITAVLYTLVKRTLCKQINTHQAQALLSTNTTSNSKRSNRSLMVDANSKLTFVPIVFVSLRVWGTVRFIVEAHFYELIGENALVWIVPLQGVGDSAQGFANCLLFCVFTSTIRHRCVELFVGCWTRCVNNFKQDNRNTVGSSRTGNQYSDIKQESVSPPETSIPNDDQHNLIKFNTTKF